MGTLFILMGALFFIIGILVMLAGLVSVIVPLKFLKITSRKMGILVLIVGFVVVIVGGGVLNSQTETTTTQTSTQTPTQTPKEKEQVIVPKEPVTQPKPKEPVTIKEMSYEEWIKVTVEKEIGEKSNLNIPRIAEIYFYDVDKSELRLTLIADDNFTTNMIKTGMLSDATDVFRVIFADARAKSVIITWLFPVTDQYGNTKMKAFMMITMSRETSNKINWNNFIYEDLPKVADYYYEYR